MTRVSFDRELKQLQDQLLELGSMVGHAIARSVEILKNQDVAEARRLMAEDSEINRRRYAIESETLILIARQQPMAIDLRILAAVLQIATELERIADYAKGIAKITVIISRKPLMKPLIDIPRMAQRAEQMLHQALESFMQRDVELARSIARSDREINYLYQQIYRELVTFILADPSKIEDASHLIWVAHNLERTADRVVNICERVIFTVTGELIDLDGASDGLFDEEDQT
jgi:phosphate transport system protein